MAVSSKPSDQRPATDTPWHSAYPQPKNQSPATVTRQKVLRMLQAAEEPRKDLVLVDLRRTDYEGGSIRGSINLPAQSLYPTIPALYSIFKAAGVEKVVWYCGSSRGRGPRAAGWFDDYIQSQKDSKMKGFVMDEGIKGWACAGEEYVALMDEYEERVWRKEP